MGKKCKKQGSDFREKKSESCFFVISCAVLLLSVLNNAYGLDPSAREEYSESTEEAEKEYRYNVHCGREQVELKDPEILYKSNVKYDRKVFDKRAV